MTSTPHPPDDPEAGLDPGPDADDAEQDMREADTANGERPPEVAQP